MKTEAPARRSATASPRLRPAYTSTMAKTVVRYALLAVLGLIFLFPFWWLVTSSLKHPNEIFTYPPELWPADPRWANFVEIFTFQPFARHMFNSVYIALAVTLGTLLVSAAAGYAFARLRFRGSSVILLVLVAGLMMPVEVTIIPNFALMRVFGWVDTHIPLIVLPVFGAHAVFGTFLMRQFFIRTPREPEEAGMLDGLGTIGVFWYIALPLARPALGALGIITFLHSWNMFLEPLVFIEDPALRTVPLSLASFTSTYGAPIWHLQLAATTASVVPMLIAFVVARRQLMESFAYSGIKG